MAFIVNMLANLDLSVGLGTVVTLVAFVLTALVYRRVAYNRKYNWPPGPWGWPLIGCSRLISISSKQTPANITRMGKRYHPDLFTVPLFAGKRIVILNSFKAIKDALIRQSAYTSGRPENWAFKYVKEKHTNLGMFFERYSASWKREKRFMVRTSRHFGYGITKSQDFVLREANHLVELIKKRKGQPFELHPPLALCMLNVTLSIVFNTAYEEGDEDFGKMLFNLMTWFAEIFALYDLEPFLPFLERFGLHSSLKRGKLVTNAIATFVRDQIDQHRATLDSNHPRDMVDEFLIEIAKNDPNGDLRDLDDEKFVWMFINLLPDQADTAPSIFKFLMLATSVFQEMQQRVFEEIQHVIGDREPTLDDRGKLPYTEAVILEVLRMDTPFWLLVPHDTQEDVDILGFKIPKDTSLIPNIYAVHNDPELWGDPENFRPERFLGEDGQLVKPEYLIPFSTGQRQCFGSQMAQKEFFIFYISLIQKFKFKLPDGDPVPELKSVSLVHVSPAGYRLHAELRE
ncbi:cytochrome P450 2D3-like [Patiria miniata]|uniref:Cytochrome P450 n=1 Tax=Patiria miniata TaxID=46514 RepID=A0A914B0F5_PATMI|nr:cytochrome P450 2D3-like [Patiria miniata]